jgi:hypothetical protein
MRRISLSRIANGECGITGEAAAFRRTALFEDLDEPVGGSTQLMVGHSQERGEESCPKRCPGHHVDSSDGIDDLERAE